MTDEIDILIPVHPKDHRSVDASIAGAERNIHGIRRIYVVSAEPYESTSARVTWVPEPTRDDFPTLAEIRERWEKAEPSLAWRAGWVFQQLLTLGAAHYIDDLLPSYLQVNADTIFLRPVDFIIPGRRFVYAHSSYPEHRPYVDAYIRFTGDEPLDQSFTVHHMLYNAELLRDLFAHVENKHGKPWFEAYLDSIDYTEISAVNEQDTYANWVLAHHADTAVLRPLRWADIRYVPTTGFGRRRLARRFDFVTAHRYMRILSTHTIRRVHARGMALTLGRRRSP